MNIVDDAKLLINTRIYQLKSVSNRLIRTVTQKKQKILHGCELRQWTLDYAKKGSYTFYTQPRKQGCHPYCLQEVDAAARKDIGKSLLEAENGEMQ